MSEQPKPLENAVVSEDSGYRKFLSFSVGRPQFSRQHPAYLIAAVIIIVLLALWGGFAIWNHQTATHLSKLQSAAKAQAAHPKPTVATQATTLANTAGYQSGLSYIDSEIAKTTDKKIQGSLYEDKSSLAINDNDYAAALEYAQTAESLNPTANTAQLIAQAAEVLGNKQLAIEYYQKEISRLPANLDDYTIPGIQARIKQLGG